MFKHSCVPGLARLPVGSASIPVVSAKNLSDDHERHPEVKEAVERPVEASNPVLRP